MIRSIATVLLMFSSGILGLPAMPAAGEIPEKAEVEELVRQLADERFAVRQKAEEELMEMGEPVEKSLHAFRNDPDPETRQRVQRVFDHLASLRRELKCGDPKREGKGEYISRITGESVKLTFRNLSSKPIRIFWIDTAGRRKTWRGVLKPGATAICDQSYMTHVWLITDVNEKPLGIYKIDIEDPVIAVRDEIGEK